VLAGALTTAASGSIAAQPAPPANPTPTWPSRAVGLAWQISLGGAEPVKPVTVTVPYDPSLLPAGTAPSELFLAYRDPTTNAWVAVPSTVDASAHTVSAQVSHLSLWAPFTIDWNYWGGLHRQGRQRQHH